MANTTMNENSILADVENELENMMVIFSTEGPYTNQIMYTRLSIALNYLKKQMPPIPETVFGSANDILTKDQLENKEGWLVREIEMLVISLASVREAISKQKIGK